MTSERLASGGCGNLCGRKLGSAPFGSQRTSDSLGVGRILPETLGKVMSNGHLKLPGLWSECAAALHLLDPAPIRPLRVGLLPLLAPWEGARACPCRFCPLKSQVSQGRRGGFFALLHTLQLQDMGAWASGSLKAIARTSCSSGGLYPASILYFNGSSLSLSAFMRGLLAHLTCSLSAVSLPHCVTSGRWLCSSVRNEATREGCLSNTMSPHSPPFTDYWRFSTLFSISAFPNVTVADSWESKQTGQAAIRE